MRFTHRATLVTPVSMLLAAGGVKRQAADRANDQPVSQRLSELRWDTRYRRSRPHSKRSGACRPFARPGGHESTRRSGAELTPPGWSLGRRSESAISRPVPVRPQLLRPQPAVPSRASSYEPHAAQYCGLWLVSHAQWLICWPEGQSQSNALQLEQMPISLIRAGAAENPHGSQR